MREKPRLQLTTGQPTQEIVQRQLTSAANLYRLRQPAAREVKVRKCLDGLSSFAGHELGLFVQIRADLQE